MFQAGTDAALAASKVSADVRRTMNAAEQADPDGQPRPLSDDDLNSAVLAGRLPGLGAGSPGPTMRMGEANAAGGHD